MELWHRLKIVRQELELSQRGMSLKLGLSPNSWATYESGASGPGSEVIAALGSLGIDLNWLLLGVGDMWRPGFGGKSEGLAAHVERSQADLLSSLGVGRLAVLARRGRLQLSVDILQALFEQFPKGISIDQLVERMPNRHRSEVETELFMLRDDGCIEEEICSGQAAYRPTGYLIQALPSSKGDAEQVLLSAAELLLRDIGPKAAANRGDGILVQVSVYVDSGHPKDLVRDITEYIRLRCSEAVVADRYEKISLLFGACSS